MKIESVIYTKDYKTTQFDGNIDDEGLSLRISHYIASDVFNVVESLCVGTKSYAINGYWDILHELS